MLSYLKAKKIGDHVPLLTAVRFRMCALSRLRDQPAFAAWSMKAAKAGEPTYFIRHLSRLRRSICLSNSTASRLSSPRTSLGRRWNGVRRRQGVIGW